MITRMCSRTYFLFSGLRQQGNHGLFRTDSARTGYRHQENTVTVRTGEWIETQGQPPEKPEGDSDGSQDSA